uniref:Recep_L_domain domain-containing protein n=1 Tax=Strongyloides stercoralis TaxID=6248 RepID=A0A0K0DU53_STRER
MKVLYLIILHFILINVTSSVTTIKLLDCQNSGMDYVEVSGMNCLMDRNFYEEDVKIVTYDRFNDRCMMSNEKVFISKDYIIVLSTNESYYINPPQWSDIPSCISNIKKYQITYLYENIFLLRKSEGIKKAVGVDGEVLFEKICNNINFMLSNFSSNNSDEHRSIIRNYLRKYNVDGYVFNNKGYSKKCKVVEGLKMYEKKEVYGKCYKEMPIVVNKEIKFTKNMIDIQNIGTVVDCKTKTILYKENNQMDFSDEILECSTVSHFIKLNSIEYSLLVFIFLTSIQLLTVVIFILATIFYYKKSEQLNKLKKDNREASLILLSKNNSIPINKNKTNSIQCV